MTGSYPWRTDGWHKEYTSSYAQSFNFDALGNVTRKTSTETGTPPEHPWEDLDYDLSYQYYRGKVHQAERIGNIWYRYDANGNLVEERRSGHGQDPVEDPWVRTSGDLGTVNRGFGLEEPAEATLQQAQQEASLAGTPGYGDADGRPYLKREYTWDEENRLIRTVEHEGQAVEYRLRGRRAAGGEVFHGRGDPLLRQHVDRHGGLA